MDVMMRRRELMGMQGRLKTVSGPIVTVNDALARNVKSLVVNFAPVQAAGTPAPDNVLPISGWTGVTGYVSPTLNAQDGTAYPVDWTDVAGTVYGGYVDLVSGVLVAEWAEAIFDGTENWNVYSNGPTTNLCYYRGQFGKKLGIANVKCNKLDLYTNKLWDSTAYYKISGHPTRKTIYITAGSELSGGVTEFQQWLSENPVTVTYELATPITYQLTPQTIAMLAGTNNVWSNANGNVELTYYAQ